MVMGILWFYGLPAHFDKSAIFIPCHPPWDPLKIARFEISILKIGRIGSLAPNIRSEAPAPNLEAPRSYPEAR
jgi:hypothetical protein